MLLFALFVLVPIVEVATALAGTLLVRRQGRAAFDRLQADLHRGADPGAALAQGAAILVAGVLLLTPGFFTDALGLALLLPPSRAWLLRFALRRILLHGVRVHPGGPGRRPHGAGPAPDDPIEAEYTVLDEDRPERRHGGHGH